MFLCLQPKNVHLIFKFLTLKQTTNCKPRSSNVCYLSNSEVWQVVHQQNKTLQILLWSPCYMSWRKNLLAEEGGREFPSAIISQCVSSICAARFKTLSRAWERIPLCSYPDFLQQKQITEFGHFCTFPSKLFQHIIPSLIPVSMFSNPLSHLSQLCSTKSHPFPCPYSMPSQILAIFSTQTYLSSQDWEVYWPHPLLLSSSSVSKKQR